jgi:glycerate 2-kinase
VICAPNAFKGTLTAAEAAIAMALGVEDSGGQAVARPVADGGDGTLDVLIAAAGDGSYLTHHSVTGPNSEPVTARVGWRNATSAVVELADAAGLRLLDPAALQPLTATTRGVGELIAAALAAGAEEVILGVGGSASSDGGAGLLQALGARLLDRDGEELGPGGAELGRLERIDLSGLRGGSSIRVACDVTNPLLGPLGAAAVFGPQKGATAADVESLERGLARLAAVAARDAGARYLADQPGAGAAGGAGFGLLLAGASLEPGAALVCDAVGLEPGFIAGFDRVLTGEGRLDSQTRFGKAPGEVALRARAAGVAADAVAGQVGDPLPDLFERTLSLESLAAELGGGRSARRDAAELLREAAARLISAEHEGGS